MELPSSGHSLLGGGLPIAYKTAAGRVDRAQHHVAERTCPDGCSPVPSAAVLRATLEAGAMMGLVPLRLRLCVQLGAALCQLAGASEPGKSCRATPWAADQQHQYHCTFDAGRQTPSQHGPRESVFELSLCVQAQLCKAQGCGRAPSP